MARTRDGSGLFCAQKTTFLQITIWVIRVASCRRRSRTLVGMMGTLAGQPVGTVGAIGCVLQPEKGPVASSSEQRKHGWMWRETVLSFVDSLWGFTNLTPDGQHASQQRRPGGNSLMEQAGLNQPTPSAGSTHQRFRAGRPPFARSTCAFNFCRK